MYRRERHRELARGMVICGWREGLSAAEVIILCGRNVINENTDTVKNKASREAWWRGRVEGSCGGGYRLRASLMPVLYGERGGMLHVTLTSRQ